MNIFITGGAGYCGSRLVPQLLSLGHKITVYDTCFYGSESLPLAHPNLELVIGDIRDLKLLEKSCSGKDIFLSLACISNDASFELDEVLSTTINLDAFLPMVKAAKKSGIRRFIYASSSSVYGVSDSDDVREDHPLIPLTLYNKYKGMCEPLLLSQADSNFEAVIFRPATVCGYSPRQRFDLSVNILTNQAITNGHMTIFGGEQRRPNIHIQDYVDVVKLLIEAPANLIENQIFNVGNENLTINAISQIVKQVVLKNFPDKGDIDITYTSSDDNRSYHINSDKILNVLGFKASRTIADAVQELCEAFKDNKFTESLENDNYYNVRKLKKLGIK